jgi:hypothetical protein
MNANTPKWGNSKKIFLFAFICVMHMDVRMPQAQDAQERRICG